MLTQFTLDSGNIIKTSDESAPLLVFIEPNDVERAFIRDQFRLDEYDLASTLDPDEVPRLEPIQDGALIIWKVPESAQIDKSVEFGVRSAGLVVTRDRLAIVMDKDRISFGEREFRGAQNFHDILLRFFLHSIRHYVGHLRAIKQISGELEKKITISMENRYLLQMFALSESLVYYVDAIEGNGSMLSKLRGLSSQFAWENRHLQMLDDVILENSQAARQADIYSSVLSGLMDARGTIVNNNMNVLLKNLTIINIVFLPLNLIASIGGMSEWTMMTQGVDWRISYTLFCAGMAVFGWLTWIVVRRVIERSGKQVFSLSKLFPIRLLTRR